MAGGNALSKLRCCLALGLSPVRAFEKGFVRSYGRNLLRTGGLGFLPGKRGFWFVLAGLAADFPAAVGRWNRRKTAGGCRGRPEATADSDDSFENRIFCVGHHIYSFAVHIVLLTRSFTVPQKSSN